MKKIRKLMVLSLSAFMLFACGGEEGSSTASDSSSGEPTSSDSSSGTSGSSAASTTIEPSSIEPYEDAGYSYSDISDYSSLLDSEVSGKIADASLPSSYTTLSDAESAITSPGSYYLNGTIESISLALTSSGDVHLYLDGATLSGANKAIESDSADLTSTLYITLLNGSTNTISTSKNSIDVLADVVVNGNGTLNITSSGKSCLKSEGRIILGEVTLNLSAEAYEDGHGVSGESIIASKTVINVTDCGKDGLHAELADAGLTSYVNSEGYVHLTDVTYSYYGEGDGIQGDSFVYINGGTFNMENYAHWVAYGSSEASDYGITDGDDFKYRVSGNSYQKVDSESRGVSGTYALANSVKGIKVGEIDQEDADGNSTDISSEYYEIVVKGGTFTFNTVEDCFHSNLGSLTLTGAKVTASCLDQPLSSDGPLTINDGCDIDILSSYEGMQGSSIHINGDTTTIDIVADDDGMNASTDYLEEDPDFYALRLIINGGTINVVAGGDGLDSNGSMIFNGGTTYVEAGNVEAESPLDSASYSENPDDYGIYCDGGTVLATGPNGMLESPQNDSTVNCIVYGGASLSSGTTVSISDSEGNLVLSNTLTNAGGALIASSPEFEQGSTYTIKIGNSSTEVTLSSRVTVVGQSGGFQPGGGPGEGGNPGGGPGGGRP